jgi:hypothetical protein
MSTGKQKEGKEGLKFVDDPIKRIFYGQTDCANPCEASGVGRGEENKE